MISAVEFQGVSKRFGETVALANISFSVKPGEIIALLGPSGCGKTTILRLIAGFERPDKGSIMIDGKPMAGLKPYERNVGLLFQHYALFPHMSVEQNIGYGLRHRNHAPGDIPGRVAEMLELVRLVGFGARRPHQLSGGQQQRVALARALATRPNLVLLDEPLSALDAKLRHELRAELKEVLASVGSTAIVVTHDQEEAMSLGERIFVMNRGAVMQSGRPDDVYWRPDSRFVADFMGRTNWIHGSVSSASGTARKFRSESGWEFAVASAGSLSGAAEVCVRPESVEIVSGAATAGAMTGRVADVVTLGAFRHVVLDLASGDRIVSACPNRPDIAFARGQEISISIPPEACVLFERQADTDVSPANEHLLPEGHGSSSIR